MKTGTVCPFFRKGEEYCDVGGGGYISPHDVTMIIAHCHGRYCTCPKYEELTMRFPQEWKRFAAQPRSAPPVSTPQPSNWVGREAAPGPPVVRPFRVKWPLPFHLRYTAAYYSEQSPIANQANPAKERTAMMMNEKTAKAKGWTVALAGTGINLALGVLYAWSIFKGSITESINKGGEGAFTWDLASINDPYATACLVFAFIMIVAGKFQDKIGPRFTAMLGGVLVGAGFILASQSNNYWAWVIGFGVLAGAGFGFGYAAATPPALKWFPPAKTGLIAGIVVAGFGLAPVYIAPLGTYLLGAYGLSKAMFILGVAFIVIVCGMALMVSNPPQGYIAGTPAAAGAAKKPVKPTADATPSQLLKEGRFYTLWLTFFIGSGAGLMVIGSIAGMAKQSMGTLAFLAVAIMAVGNASGRVIAGLLSDKIGRANTLVIMLVFQATLMFAAIPVIGSSNGNAILIVLLATFIGFNYGTNLCLFPSFAKDLWGLKNFGQNYGLLFTAWGAGGFFLVKVAEMLKAKFGSFTVSFAAAGVLLLIGAVMALSLRPRRVEAEATAPVLAGAEEDELVLQKIPK